MDQSPFPIDLLETPAILIDLAVLDANIARMQALADARQLSLRPHIKTHKSVALANRQLAAGASGVAVAKLSEAEVMAEAGITDIQIANQIVGRSKIERLAALSERVALSTAVDSLENVLQMDDIFTAHGLVANVLIEVDSGLHRAGLSQWTEILDLAKEISHRPHCKFVGLMTHAGHAYAARSIEEVKSIAKREGSLLADLGERLRNEGFIVPIVSAGSTPTAYWVAQVPGITELRVGNYIFNDAIQVALGVAQWTDCALSVLTTVTSVHTDRVVIDAGSKVFSSDCGAHGSTLLSGFGQVIERALTVTRLSEEHGVVQLSRSGDFQIGDRIHIIPNHACPVMNLAQKAWLVQSGMVVDAIEIEARGMTE